MIKIKIEKLNLQTKKKKYDALYTGEAPKLLIVDSVAGSRPVARPRSPPLITQTGVNMMLKNEGRVMFNPETVRNIKTQNFEVYDTSEIEDTPEIGESSLSFSAQAEMLANSELQRDFSSFDPDMAKSVKTEALDDSYPGMYSYPHSSMYNVSSNMYKLTTVSDDDDFDTNDKKPITFQHNLNNGPMKNKSDLKQHPYKNLVIEEVKVWPGNMTTQWNPIMNTLKKNMIT